MTRKEDWGVTTLSRVAWIRQSDKITIHEHSVSETKCHPWYCKKVPRPGSHAGIASGWRDPTHVSKRQVSIYVTSPEGWRPSPRALTAPRRDHSLPRGWLKGRPEIGLGLGATTAAGRQEEGVCVKDEESGTSGCHLHDWALWQQKDYDATAAHHPRNEKPTWDGEVKKVWWRRKEEKKERWKVR